MHTANTVRDPRFTTGDLVRLTAAVAGISQYSWESLTVDEATEDCAKARMAERRYDVLPIETDGSATAYFKTLEWNDYSSIARANISEADLIPFDTDIREVVRGLAEKSRLFYFLSDDHGVVGLISVVNLNRRPVKVWLFSLLSEVEMRLGEYLSGQCKDDKEIYDLTLACSKARKHDAVKKRYKADQENGLDLPLVEYLYFADLIDAVCAKGLYAQLGYTQSGFEESLRPLVDLRNRVAHPSQSLIREPEEIGSLWGRVKGAGEAINALKRNLPAR